MAPRLVEDYDPELTRSSHGALLELSLALGAYRDALVLVGGWVPYLLLEDHGRGDFAHVGSIDIDLAVDPGLVDREVYATIVELVMARGYVERVSRTGETIPFSFLRTLPATPSGRRLGVQVDFLTCGPGGAGTHRHRRVQPDLPARVARGCGLAFRHNTVKRLEGTLPDGGEAACEIRMLDIPGCVGMKGIVLGQRYREKDAYDIYSVVGHCLDGPTEVARLVKERSWDAELSEGLEVIGDRFRSIRAEGPAWVAAFLQPEDEAMRQRVAADAYVKVARFLEALRP